MSPIALLLKRKCDSDDGDNCETGSGGFNTSMAVGIAIAVPIVLFGVILLIAVIKNYKKNKREAEDFHADPNFAPEETALPDYPDPQFYQNEKGMLRPDMANNQASKNARSQLLSLSAPRMRHDNESYSSNSDASSIAQTIQKHPNLDNIALPFESDSTSSHHLNQYARMLGTDYRAYSGMKSYGSSSSLTDVSSFTQQKKALGKNSDDDNDYETSTLNDPFSGTPSPSTETFKADRNLTANHVHVAQNSALRNEVVITPPQPEEHESSFYESRFPHYEKSDADPYAEAMKKDTTKASEDSLDNVQDINPYAGLVNEQPVSKSVKFTAASTIDAYAPESSKYDRNLNPDNYLDTDNHRVSIVEDDGLTNEERENLRRMKSVYKVYFDRNNSVKHPKTAEEEQLDREENINQDLPHVNTQFNNNPDNNDDVLSPNSLIDDIKQKRLTDLSTASSNYNSSHIDSTYLSPTLPIQPTEDTPQISVHHQFQDTTNQSYNPQQYSDYNHQIPYDNTYQQQYSPQTEYGQQFPHHAPMPVAVAPIKPLEPLKKLPTASELGDVTNSNFLEFQASKKNQNRNKVGNVKPYNPLEHSESWSPTISPPSQSTGKFFNPLTTDNNYGPTNPVTGSPTISGNTAPAPSASAMSRSSIVMLNTTDIGGAKKYKPANARKYVPQHQQQQQLPPQQQPTNIPNSSRKGGNKNTKNLRKMLDDPMFK